VKPSDPIAPVGPAWRRAVVVTIAAAAACGVAVAAAGSGVIWSSFAPGDCTEYCEASTRCGALATRAAVQQPANAWSNLAYVFVGALAWRRPLRPTALVFAVSCAVLAVGSFAFHASVTRETQWLDMVGTYAAVIAVGARGIAAAWPFEETRVAAAALAVITLFAVYKWAISATVALPLLVAAAVLPMRRWVQLGWRPARAAWIPGGLLAAAFALRQLDVAKIGCAPESLVQGHAAWHVLTAASLGAAFFFFDRERRA